MKDKSSLPAVVRNQNAAQRFIEAIETLAAFQQESNEIARERLTIERERLEIERRRDERERAVAKRQGTREDRESLAIAKLQTIGPNVSKIAAAIGVDRKTLNRSPRFMRAVKAARLANSGVVVNRSGYKTSDGNFEAWDERDIA